jgi:hypothetical protein
MAFPAGGPEHLDELLGRCDQLRAFARIHGFELDRSLDDLALLDGPLARPSISSMASWAARRGSPPLALRRAYSWAV